MSKVYRDVYGNEISNEPKPVDEQPEAEIRGGNRREDYMPNTNSGEPDGTAWGALPPGDSFEEDDATD